MKTFTRSLPLALVALVWMGCEQQQTQQQPGMQEEQPGMQQDEQQVGAAGDQQQQQQDAVAVANMQGQQGSENLQGSLVFTEQDGQHTLTAALTGLQEGQHKVYVHEGSSCDNPGPVLSQGQMQGELGELDASSGGELTNEEIDLPTGLQFQGSNSVIGKVVTVYRQSEDGGTMQGAQQQPGQEQQPMGQAAEQPGSEAQQQQQQTAGIQPEGQMVACGVIMGPDGAADAGDAQDDGSAAAKPR